MHWKQGWPLHYPNIHAMPYDVAKVFTRMLYSDQSEEESADILGDLMAKMAEVRESF